MSRLLRSLRPLALLALTVGCAPDPTPPRADGGGAVDVAPRDPPDARADATAADLTDVTLAEGIDVAPADAPPADVAAPDVALPDAAPPDVAPDDVGLDVALPDVVCGAGLTRCGDGCVDRATNASHCGACGRACDIPHASVACADGACRLAACDEGFADCNGDPADGCEVDLLADPAHCGACPTACAFARAGARCEGGACVMGACEGAFADCNGRADDGCEADTASDPAHCGACAQRCALPGVSVAACVGGACAVGACAAGRGDCDAARDDGCEVDLRASAAHCGACGRACAAGEVCSDGACVRLCAAGQTRCASGCVALASDPANCGACGRTCAAPGGVAGCAGGVCTVAACAPGRGDCDGAVANGCEVDLRANAAHCAGCGLACAVANATAACAAGRCVVAACRAGFGDCNRSPADGCEVDLRTSATHCGACGNRCGPGLVCRDGACRCAAPRGSPGTFSRTVRAGGETRRYRVFVPPGYDRAAATPTLVVYHGFGMTPDEMAADTRLDAEAALRPTIVAYPEGRYYSWNASICCPLATTASTDDIAFFDAMLRDLSATFCVDPRRVGLAGYSNGSMMAQRIACQRAAVVSSVSAVSGPYDGSCAPSRPVPILYAHATDDTRVPYNGGATSGLAGAFLPSVDTTLRRWRGFDRCGSATTVWRTVGDTTCFRYDGCAAEVSHCRVGSGGHRWPRPPQAFSASPAVMEFFRAHPLP